MRLEPVAKRPTQNARGGARRAAFHHKMLAVKKVCGVAGIKRQRAKSLEGLEDRARPFPTVAQEVFDAKRAGAGGVRADRAGVPSLKIKIALPHPGPLLAPPITASLPP